MIRAEMSSNRAANRPLRIFLTILPDLWVGWVRVEGGIEKGLSEIMINVLINNQMLKHCKIFRAISSIKY